MHTQCGLKNETATVGGEGAELRGDLGKLTVPDERGQVKGCVDRGQVMEVEEGTWKGMEYGTPNS